MTTTECFLSLWSFTVLSSLHTGANWKISVLHVAVSLSLFLAFQGVVDGQEDELRGIEIKSEVEEYEVQGETILEVDQSLREHRLVKWNAKTAWVITWNGRFRKVRRKFRIDEFRVQAEVRTTLPKLVDADQKDEVLKKEWMRYSKALKTHEKGHEIFATEAAIEFRKRVLREIDREDSSEELQERINDLLEIVTSKYQELERDYDKKTDHGRSQGARLKLPKPEVSEDDQESVDDGDTTGVSDRS